MAQNVDRTKWFSHEILQGCTADLTHQVGNACVPPLQPVLDGTDGLSSTSKSQRKQAALCLPLFCQVVLRAQNRPSPRGLPELQPQVCLGESMLASDPLLSH